MRNFTEEELRWIETFDGVKRTDPWLCGTENGLQGLAIRAHKAGLLSLVVDGTMSVCFPAIKALLEDFTQK